MLGIDHGRARLGVALSDPSGLLATPLQTLDARRLKPLLANLKRLVLDHQVEALVLGLPLQLQDGTEGTQAQAVRKFARILQEQLDLPVHFQDERLTSQEASRLARQNLDSVAAALILQAYLDERKRTSRREAPPS
ncbi:MAG: putative pre-16S rRNA nuclease [Candidatus Xenobia bacterium]